MTCGGEFFIDFEGLNGLKNGVYMATWYAVCVYLWLKMFDLG